MTDSVVMYELNRVWRAHKTLEVLTNYKGVPVLCYATVHSLNDDRVVLNAQAPEGICLGFASLVTLMSDMLPDAISAEVSAFNPQSLQVELTHLSLGLTHFGDRTTVRVQPDQPVLASVHAGDHSLPAYLADVSVDGASVHVLVNANAEWVTRRGEVFVTLDLGGPALTLAANVRHVNPLGDGLRLGLVFNAEDSARGQLMSYINQRRSEITAEIRSLYSSHHRDSAG